ncbi:MAG TPA: hypothetical protein VIS94_13490 [Desulfomonilia bacterium]
MRSRRNLFYLLAVLLAFVFSSGFLGFCVGSNYKPCTIEFTSPPNGTILAPGTTDVVIKGIVKSGDSKPLSLTNNGKTVAFDKTTGKFQYTLKLDQNSIYTTTTFQVTDSKYIVNKERISYAIGYSAQPGASGVVDNALRLMLTEDLLGQVVDAAASFMNTWKNDLVYGWNNGLYGSLDPASPFAGITPILPIQTNVSDGMNGYIRIDPQMSGNDKGYINIGNISIDSDIKADRTISTQMSITPEAWVNPNGGRAKALFVQGHYRTYPLGIETRIHFNLKADSVNISNAKLKLSVNSKNKIVATIDLSHASVSLGNPEIEFGILSIPSWFVSFIIDIVKSDILSKLVVDTELIDINSLAGNILGININGWPMDKTNLYSATENDITMDLGLGSTLADPSAEVQIPGLNMFYSTPFDQLPPLQIAGNENLIMAINDDLINNIVFNALQAGLLKDLDISEEFKALVKSIMPRDNIECYVTITTPPIVDFSGNYSDTLGITDVGRIIVRNVILELHNVSIIAPKYPCVLRVSADLDLVLKLILGPDGKTIRGTIDTDNSEAAVLTFLYTNSTTSAILPTIKDKIGKEITSQLKGAIEKMLNFSIPAIPVYGQSIGLELKGTELAQNSIIVKVKLDIAR